MAPQKTKTSLSLPLLRRRAEEEGAALPALIAAAQKAAHTALTGEHAQKRAGSGEKFWQFRDYTPGDRPQDIDWRQSAKGDRIFVREKERQIAQTVTFWCAGGPGMAYQSDISLPTKHETAAIIALGLAVLLIRGGERIGYINAPFPHGRGENTLEKMGQTMLENADGIVPATPHTPRNSLLVLTGDFLEDTTDLEKKFSTLAEQCRSAVIIQVLDPAEITLPFSGRFLFEEPAGENRIHLVQDVAAIRQAYQTKLNSHLDAVRALCRRHGWSYILHSTDQPAGQTLAALWALLSQERAAP